LGKPSPPPNRPGDLPHGHDLHTALASPRSINAGYLPGEARMHHNYTPHHGSWAHSACRHKDDK